MLCGWFAGLSVSVFFPGGGRASVRTGQERAASAASPRPLCLSDWILSPWPNSLNGLKRTNVEGLCDVWQWWTLEYFIEDNLFCALFTRLIRNVKCAKESWRWMIQVRQQDNRERCTKRHNMNTTKSTVTDQDNRENHIMDLKKGRIIHTKENNYQCWIREAQTSGSGDDRSSTGTLVPLSLTWSSILAGAGMGQDFNTHQPVKNGSHTSITWNFITNWGSRARRTMAAN